MQYGSEGSEVILVPIILELNELSLITARVSVQLASFVSLSVCAGQRLCLVSSVGGLRKRILSRV